MLVKITKIHSRPICKTEYLKQFLSLLKKIFHITFFAPKSSSCCTWAAVIAMAPTKHNVREFPVMHLQCSGPVCSLYCTVNQLQLSKRTLADKYLTDTDFFWQDLPTNTNLYSLLPGLEGTIMTAKALGLTSSLYIWSFPIIILYEFAFL
jgi:hypothetical protein